VKHPLLHPVALGALALLVLNDHLFKRVCPSPVTGKLSDFAGVFVLPLVLSAAFEVFAPGRFRERLAEPNGKAPVTARAANRVLGGSVLATMIVFTAVELFEPADSFYRYAIGVLQWPFWAGVSLARFGTVPSVAPVTATADPTDLIALPMGVLAFAFGARRTAPTRTLPIHSSNARHGRRRTGTNWRVRRS
jgi:hypothetical protein